MITNKQVVDVVNKAIDDGEIEAGGLTPEQEEKLDNALVLPEEAPASQQLVGVNTSNEQNSLGVGDGLTVASNELLLAQEQKILVFDVSSASTSSVTVALTEAQKTFITTYNPLIKVNFTDISVLYNRFLTANHYFGFVANPTTRNISTFLDDSGNKVKVQDFYLYSGALGIDSIVFSKEVKYVLSGKPSYIVPTAETGIAGVNSGSTITNDNVKKVIQSSGCLKINARMAYPMYRNTSNKISYYFNTISNLGNLVQTVYEINENTWVITFVTKTIQ
jgi:hypothetical protein